MIVPMKKATILVESKDAEEAVRCLRTLGVLHVEHQNPPEGRDISALQEQLALLHASFDVLGTVAGPPVQQGDITGDWTTIAEHITALGRRREELESSARNLAGQVQEWEPWGDVDAGQVEHLRENGVHLQLYQVPVKELGRFPEGVAVKVLSTTGGVVRCAAVSRGDFTSPFPEIPPPQESLSAMRERLEGMNKELEEIGSEIARSACYRGALSRMQGDLEKEIRFREVLAGMGREGPIAYLTGYIPADIEERFVSLAKERRWGILVTDPEPGDPVPTLLRNPPWVDRIKPVLGLLGLTPGYRELDVSMLFLVFLSLFFGILIGDAGYGLVYILIALGLSRVMKPEGDLSTMFSLVYLLGSCTIIWGVLTGTFFGQEWLLGLGYSPPVPQLNDPGILQSLCFFIGALHLSIAHSWRAYLKFPSPKALADAGYICILWGAFFLARTLILGEAFPPYGIWLFAAGVILVIVFINPQAHVLRGIGEGMGTMALSFMNNITDVISYIRLFAVGMATLAVAETTNYLASGFGSGIVALAAGFVILLFGHSLNIVLGLMSVLVHGVRLNVLEFSGHANVTWSGVPFEPLSEGE
jgi:V/A-type H+/Na+-transporting ATPase subunit I